MRQIIQPKVKGETESALNINIKYITFEGLLVYKKEDYNIIEAVFSGLNSDDVLMNIRIPMSLSEGESIDSFEGLIINKPIISAVVPRLLVVGLPKISNNEYRIPVMLELPNSKQEKYYINLQQSSMYIMSYILDCLYKHNNIDVEKLNSFYNLYINEYDNIKIHYSTMKDVDISKIHINKSGIIYFILNFKQIGNNCYCLFMASVPKSKVRKIIKNLKNNNLFESDFEKFKEYSVKLEENNPVYIIEEYFVLSYESKRRGNNFTNAIFINHFSKKNLVFIEFEFNKLVEDLKEYIDK